MPSGRRWRNHSIELERDQRRVRWLWAMWLGIVISLVPAGAYLLQQSKCLEASYELNELRQESDRLVEIERRLRADCAALESLSSIESWASRHEMLTLPAAQDVRVLGRSAAETGRLIAGPSETRRE